MVQNVAIIEMIKGEENRSSCVTRVSSNRHVQRHDRCVATITPQIGRPRVKNNAEVLVWGRKTTKGGHISDMMNVNRFRQKLVFWGRFQHKGSSDFTEMKE